MRRNRRAIILLLLTGTAALLSAPVLTQAQSGVTVREYEFHLSHGFGDSYPAETLSQLPETVPEPETIPVQAEPTDAAEPVDPGPKPYPETWTLTGGSILPMHYDKYTGGQYFDLERAGQVQNQTTLTNESLKAESTLLPEFRITMHGDPQVLIMHTHTTESFEPYERESYDDSFNYRTTDPTKNMVMVGDAIAAQLEAAGIGFIHAADIHDYPSYTGSYARSAETVKRILAEYSSIKVVLDVHRDAIGGNGVLQQPTVEVNGQRACQVMIISGCDDGTMNMPNYLKNFRFACLWQQQMEEDYPGLTRPILFDYRKYNQDLTTGSLLIEVGTHGNTLEQAEYAGELVGSSLARALMKLSE